MLRQGLVFFGVGIILNFQSIQTYVVDAFALYAASGHVLFPLMREKADTVL